MAWEKRAGRLYYYRSRREGSRVAKEYVGSGPAAQLLAGTDRAVREERELRAARGRLAVCEAEGPSAPLFELDEAAEALARAHLLAAGWHRHKGEWRMRRGRGRTTGG